ncbi:MAG: hypothetical protein SFY92_07665 [Verrucomicrobiae bacterium]|nr:hypothetical protein [Verrucomicrobiae bacterium]
MVSLPLIYPDVTLRQVSLTVGILYVLSHAWAVFYPKTSLSSLRRFPRNHFLGAILILFNIVWVLWLCYQINIGSFAHWRHWIVIASPVAAFLIIRFVTDFLAVRALGCLLLMAACPILKSAFLQEPWERLILVVLAYAWVIAGMFMVGKPYLMRDALDYLRAHKTVYAAGAMAGLLFGLLLIVLAFLRF